MYLVRLAPLSKSPVPGELQISNDPAVHGTWLDAGNNVGYRLEENRRIAVDMDTLEGARDCYRKLVHTGLCNLVLRTRRGAHFIFDGKGETWPDEGWDMKGNGHIVWPPSVVRHKDGSRWTYHFVLGNADTRPLPFPAHLFPRPKRERSTNIEIQPNDDRLRVISRAMEYAVTMDPSMDHDSPGDGALYRFACHMVRTPPNGFGLAIEEAWPIALMFNQRCQPAWREDVVRRKLVEARKKG